MVGDAVVGEVVVGADVVGEEVVGDAVVGAVVVGAAVVGADVVGAAVVGADVVGAAVVGADVVGAAVVGDAVVGEGVGAAFIIIVLTLQQQSLFSFVITTWLISVFTRYVLPVFILASETFDSSKLSSDIDVV